MLSKLFCTRQRVLLLILFIVEFFRFRPLPFFLEEVPNSTLLALIVLLLFLTFISRSKKQIETGKFEKMYNNIMGLLFICIILNCISCQYYRHQSFFETFKAWSPILIFYLYYPLSQFRMRIKDWEWILQILFICVIIVHIIATLFPNMYLFQMSSGQDRFLEDGRVRAYSNVILWLGNIICFNKWMVKDHIARNISLFIASFFFIILTGYRIMLLADVLVCGIIYVKIKGISLKHIIGGAALGFLTIVVLSSIQMVRERWEEVIERNEDQNLDNEDYVRVVLVYYYYTEYFNSKWEMILGSGMVERVFQEGSSVRKTFPSKYSKELSDQMTDEKLMPIDVGLLGLSWEAGIPAVVLMIFICLTLTCVKQDERYLYIRAWGLFLLIISGLNPRFYYNHNLIYTVIIWLILEQTRYNNSSMLNNSCDQLNRK